MRIIITLQSLYLELQELHNMISKVGAEAQGSSEEWDAEDVECEMNTILERLETILSLFDGKD